MNTVSSQRVYSLLRAEQSYAKGTFTSEDSEFTDRYRTTLGAMVEPLRRNESFVRFPEDQFAEPKTFTLPLVRLCLEPTESERAKARFRRLRHLEANHDGEGASKADGASIDFALSFLARVNLIRTCLPTLSEEGNAVIEVHDQDRGTFSDITFVVDSESKTVQCYFSRADRTSDYIEGELDDEEVRNMLGNAACVFYD